MKNSNMLPKTTLVNRKEYIINACKGKSVIHLGCTGGLLDESSVNEYIQNFDKLNDTHSKIASVAKKITGLDISEDKIEIMKKLNIPGNFEVGNLCDPELEINDKFEIILFANLIEHLDNIGIALENCINLMNDDSKLIITTVNAFTLERLIKLLFKYESNHIEHTCYFSYLTLKRILEMNNFKIDSFYFANNERKKFSNLIDFLTYKLSQLISKIFIAYSDNLIVCASKINS